MWTDWTWFLQYLLWIGFCQRGNNETSRFCLSQAIPLLQCKKDLQAACIVPQRLFLCIEMCLWYRSHSVFCFLIQITCGQRSISLCQSKFSAERPLQIDCNISTNHILLIFSLVLQFVGNKTDCGTVVENGALVHTWTQGQAEDKV